MSDKLAADLKMQYTSIALYSVLVIIYLAAQKWTYVLLEASGIAVIIHNNGVCRRFHAPTFSIKLLERSQRYFLNITDYIFSILNPRSINGNCSSSYS